MKSLLRIIAGICLAISTLVLSAAMPHSKAAIIQRGTISPAQSSDSLALLKGEGCPIVTKTTWLNSRPHQPHPFGFFPQNTILLQLSMLAANIEWTAPKTNEMASLDDFLEPYLKKFKLPAIAAAVVSDKQIIAAGAVGVRKIGDDAEVTLNDKFHIGSCTKSFTALLATMLAADGKISLDLKVGDVFPDWDLSPEQKSITLSMLLRNRSGLGNTPPPELWSKAFSASGTPTEQRAWFLREFLKNPLAAKPDEKFIYSNVGYALAGAMIETKLKTPWETLIRERIFEPLHLKTAGFGTPTSKNDPNQPWGHQMKDDKDQPKYQAIDPYDNPPAIAPGAAVHCSILDLARYADFHMQVARGEIKTLKPFQEFLYTPPANANYAAGWLVEKRDWAGGKVITHAGSNTMFYTVIWIAPEKNFAFVLSTNAADSQGGLGGVAQQCDQIIGALIRKFVR